MKKEKMVELFSVDAELEGTIDHAIEVLQTYKTVFRQSYLRLELSISAVPSDGENLYLIGVRLETDAEESAREDKERKQMQRHNDNERKTFEDLKKKFEGQQK